MREMLAVLMALAVSACSWPAQADVWDRVHAATLSLGVPGGSCSGTAVAHTVILTAGHCFFNDKGIPTKPAYVTANGEKCEVWSMADDGSDHVLLTVGGCYFHTFAKVNANAVRPGQQVFIWGSPLWLDHQLRIGRMTGKGLLPGGAKENPVLGGEFLYFDLLSTYGDSGSGIFNMQGELIGVLSIGTDPISGGFHLMGALPLSISPRQWKDAGV